MRAFKYFLYAALSAVLVSCSLISKTEAPSEVALQAMKTRNFTIEVTYIYPSDFPAMSSSDGYTLSFNKNRMTAHLPFFGTSHSGGYGMNDGGFDFDNVTVSPKEKKSKNMVTWEFRAQSGSENVDVTLTVWDSGSAEIYLLPENRSSIRFAGEIKE